MRAYRYRGKDILPAEGGFCVPGIIDESEPVSQRAACAAIDGKLPPRTEVSGDEGKALARVVPVGGGLGVACTRLIRDIGADRGDLVEVTVRLVDDGRRHRKRVRKLVTRNP